MQLKNSYYYFKSALSPELCKKIIDHGLKILDENKKKGIDTSAVTFGNNHKQVNTKATAQEDKTLEDLVKETGKQPQELEKERYVRDSEVSWFSDKWIYDIVHPYLRTANNNAGWKYQWDHSEAFQFTIYHPGGFYGWHTDGQSDHYGAYKRYIPGVTPISSDGKISKIYTKNKNLIGKVRKLSMTINLNAPGEYEGGNLKFDFGPHASGKRFHECEEIRPQGSIIVFPSYIYHQVTPVTKGTRYSLVLWSVGNPFI
jgi:PKHD-type hydroxylase